MRFSKTTLYLISGLGIPLSGHAAEGSWSLGAGVGASTSPYKDVSTKYLPVPMIGYERGNFYFEGLEAGYKIVNSKNSKLTALTYYSPDEFDPSDSSDHRIKRVDKRHSTMMGGISYEYNTPYGKLNTTAAGDYLSISNGLTWASSWTYEYELGAVKLSSSAGIVWSNAKQNQYYYGISKKESNRSGLERYKPGSSWDPYIAIDATYNISSHWLATSGVRYTFLSSEVKDSPLVDKNGITTVNMGLTYIF